MHVCLMIPSEQLHKNLFFSLAHRYSDLVEKHFDLSPNLIDNVKTFCMITGNHQNCKDWSIKPRINLYT